MLDSLEWAYASADVNSAYNSLMKRAVIDKPKQKKTVGGEISEELATKIIAGMKELNIPVPVSDGRNYYFYDKGESSQWLSETVAFLHGKHEGPIASCDYPWLNLLRDLPELAWTCFWKSALDVRQGNSLPERLSRDWVDTLDFLANSRLLDLPGKFRLYTAKPKDGWKDDDLDDTDKTRELKFIIPTWTQGKNRYLRQRVMSWRGNDTAHILEYTPSGDFKAPKDYIVDETYDVNPVWTSKQLHEFIESVRKVEKLPLPTAELLEEASEQLGVTPIEAAIVWIGNNVKIFDYRRDMMNEFRNQYGWKVKSFNQAIEALQAAKVPSKVAVIPVLEDPKAPFAEDVAPVFRSMVKAWKKVDSSTIRIAPELVDNIVKATGSYNGSRIQSLVQMLSDAGKSSVFAKREVSFSLRKTARQEIFEQTYNPPMSNEENNTLQQLDHLIFLVNYLEPVGSPVRVALSDIISVCRKYLDDKSTLLPFGGRWAIEDFDKMEADKIVAAFSQQLGKPKRTKEGIYQFDDGLIVAGLFPPYIQLNFRPSQLDDKTIDHLIAVAQMTYSWSGSCGKAIDFATLVNSIRSDKLTAVYESNRNNPLEDGSWEQNPQLSAPEVLAKVKKCLKLEEEAAMLYLQILALPDPTKQNIQQWNNWTTKTLKAAQAALV